jgi:hypothetical protein
MIDITAYVALSGDDGVTKNASRALLVRCTVDVGPRASAYWLSLLASSPRSRPSSTLVYDPTQIAMSGCCYGDLQIIALESMFTVRWG